MQNPSQPAPTPNDRPHIADLVVTDLVERKEAGTKKYGTPLQPHNGRNSLQDLYEELLDAVQYCKQKLVEDSALRPVDIPKPMRVQDCEGCGTCHDCIMISMETAYEAELETLKSELKAAKEELVFDAREHAKTLNAMSHVADERDRLADALRPVVPESVRDAAKCIAVCDGVDDCWHNTCTVIRWVRSLPTATPVTGDDGEAVTEEWLRSVGFTTAPNPAYVRIASKENAVAVRLPNQETEIFDNDSLEMCRVPVATRGRMRNLLAALGIPAG